MKKHQSLSPCAAVLGATLSICSCGQRDAAIPVGAENRASSFSLNKATGMCDLSGRMVFHSYTDCNAWDGKLYLYEFANHTLTQISANWGIDHTINAHFSPDGAKLVFMAAPSGSHNFNSWDICLGDVNTGAVCSFSGLGINTIRDELGASYTAVRP